LKDQQLRRDLKGQWENLSKRLMLHTSLEISVLLVSCTASTIARQFVVPDLCRWRTLNPNNRNQDENVRDNVQRHEDPKDPLASSLDSGSLNLHNESYDSQFSSSDSHNAKRGKNPIPELVGGYALRIRCFQVC
jgi:hypothetical protein